MKTVYSFYDYRDDTTDDEVIIRKDSLAEAVEFREQLEAQGYIIQDYGVKRQIAPQLLCIHEFGIITNHHLKPLHPGV